MPGPFPSPLGDPGALRLSGEFFWPSALYFVDFALDFPEIQWYHTPQEKTSLSWYRAAGKASENGSRPYCAAARLGPQAGQGFFVAPGAVKPAWRFHPAREKASLTALRYPPFCGAVPYKEAW